MEIALDSMIIGILRDRSQYLLPGVINPPKGRQTWRIRGYAKRKIILQSPTRQFKEYQPAHPIRSIKTYQDVLRVAYDSSYTVVIPAPRPTPPLLWAIPAMQRRPRDAEKRRWM